MDIPNGTDHVKTVVSITDFILLVFVKIGRGISAVEDGRTKDANGSLFVIASA
jgi:hypothetical protein